MSESPRAWRFHVEGMIAFSEKVILYTDGFDQEAFRNSGLNYDATLRNLELIGEAATHIPHEVRAAHPDIPWRLVIATRNRIVDGYLGLDQDTVWSVVRSDVPSLLTALRAIPADRETGGKAP